MDTATIRRHAEAHADAVVAGDLRRAAEDLTDSGKADAPAVMDGLPKKIDSASVTDITRKNGESTSVTTYSGEGRDISVLSHWIDVDGRPMITKLTLL
jgi:hypothetical protein